jgi:ethanolamine utilization protein EutN
VTLGRVIGRVVATVKDPALVGQRLLLVVPLDADGKRRGSAQVMLDGVGAGAGETVVYVSGKEASFPFRPDSIPADASITGIVDQVSRR